MANAAASFVRIGTRRKTTTPCGDVEEPQRFGPSSSHGFKAPQYVPRWGRTRRWQPHQQWPRARPSGTGTRREYGQGGRQGAAGQRIWARAWAFATRLSSSVSSTIFAESLLRASQSTIGVSWATPSASRISLVG
jgi:hypothetical protein